MNERILIVDDHRQVLRCLEDYFGRLGCTVDAAADPDRARRLLAVRRYAVVIADLALSEGEGRDGLNLLHELSCECPATRTVLITGYATPEIECEAIRLGIDAFASKGRPLSELAGVVARLLHRAPAAVHDPADESTGQRPGSLTAADCSTLMRNSSDLVSVIDWSGIIRFQGPSSSSVLGYPPSHLVGRSILGLTHPQDREPLGMLLERCRRRPGRPLSAEHRFRAKGGSWRILESTGTNHGRALTLPGVVLNSRDVTAERASREELALSEERFRLLGENLESALSVRDTTTGRIRYVNAALERLWGRPRELLTAEGFRWADAVTQQDRPRLRAAVLALAETGRYEQSYHIARPDGTERHVLERAFTVRHSTSEPAHVVGLAEDITDCQPADSAFRRRVSVPGGTSRA